MFKLSLFSVLLLLLLLAFFLYCYDSYHESRFRQVGARGNPPSVSNPNPNNNTNPNPNNNTNPKYIFFGGGFHKFAKLRNNIFRQALRTLVELFSDWLISNVADNLDREYAHNAYNCTLRSP